MDDFLFFIFDAIGMDDGSMKQECNWNEIKYNTILNSHFVRFEIRFLFRSLVHLGQEKSIVEGINATQNEFNFDIFAV